MKGFYESVINKLKEHNCSFVHNGKGSHEIWKTKDGVKFTVSKNCYSRHTANAIMKEAKIHFKF